MPRINRFPMRTKKGLWERELSGGILRVSGLAMIGDVAYAIVTFSTSRWLYSNSGGSWAQIVSSPSHYPPSYRPNLVAWGGEIFLSSYWNHTIYRLSGTSLILELSGYGKANALVQNGAYLFSTGDFGWHGHRRDGPANWTADISDEFLGHYIFYEKVFDGAIHGQVYRYTGAGDTLTRVNQTGSIPSTSYHYQMGEFDGKLWCCSGNHNYLLYKTSAVADWVQGPNKLLPSEYKAQGCHGADGKLWVYFSIGEIWTWDGSIWERELKGVVVQWMTSDTDFLYVGATNGIYKRTFE